MLNENITVEFRMVARESLNLAVKQVCNPTMLFNAKAASSESLIKEGPIFAEINVSRKLQI